MPIYPRGDSALSCLIPMLVSVTVLTVATAKQAVAASDASPLHERFRKEAPAGWERYFEYWKTLEGSSTVERREGDSNPRLIKIRMEWKQWKDNTLTVSESSAPDAYNGNVVGVNTRYRFSLTRKSPDKPWVIQELVRFTGEEGAQKPSARIMTPVGLSLEGPGTYLPKLMKSPAIRTKSVQLERLGDEELVTVKFDNLAQDEPVRGGRFTLDPKHDWVIRKAETRIQRDDKIEVLSVQINYKTGTHDHPILTNVSVKSTLLGKDDTKVSTYGTETILDLAEAKKHPESEFTLTAFGLPEPFGTETSRPPWYLWAAAIGVACVIVGALLVRRKRRLHATLT